MRGLTPADGDSLKPHNNRKLAPNVGLWLVAETQSSTTAAGRHPMADCKVIQKLIYLDEIIAATYDLSRAADRSTQKMHSAITGASIGNLTVHTTITSAQLSARR